MHFGSGAHTDVGSAKRVGCFDNNANINSTHSPKLSI
jgi:hypothetical protein